MTTNVDDTTDRPSHAVPVVDLSLLSQSELYTLSQSSDSAFNLQNDVVIPNINYAVFNESAGSRKQTYSRFRLASASVHRRTPHLRVSHTHASSNINDPEQAENKQIIRMLKELCKSNPKFHDIDQFEDDKNGNHVNSNSAVAEFLNSETLGMKRKRGRPRKHENVVFIRPPNKRLRTYTLKKEIVYDNERDRGNVNHKGVVVNLAALAELENPFGPEIMRRTEGMNTEDELLEFLRGLNGQWGSRRRKRRVVEASEFGDVLPQGWKLSLCIKKKEGRVWLFVRRYLSPSGRQFESCKDISTYLMSVIGDTNLDQKNHVDVKTSEDISLKGSSANAEDLVLQEDTKTDAPVDNLFSSSASPSPSPSQSSCSSQSQLSPPAVHEANNCEGLATLDPMEVEVENDIESDYVECNLKDEMEKKEQFTIAPSTVVVCDPVPMTEDSNKESVISSPDKDNVVFETVDAHSDDKLNSVNESNKLEIVHDLNIESHNKQDVDIDLGANSFVEALCDMNDDVSKTDQQPLEDAISPSELLDDEVPFSIDECNKEPETSTDKFYVYCSDNKSDLNLDKGVSSENELLSQFENEEIHTTSVVRVNDPAVSETGLVTKSSIFNERAFVPNLDMDINDTSDGLTSEKEKACGESSSGFFLDRFGIDKDSVEVVKKLSTKSTDSSKAVNSENLISVGRLAHDTYNNNNSINNKLSSGSDTSRHDGQFDMGTNAFGSFVASGIEGVNTFQEDNELNKNHAGDIPFSTLEQITSESSLLPSGSEQPSNKQEAKLDDFNMFRNNVAKHNESDDVLGFNTKSNLEFCSLVPSENEQGFEFQDDVSCLYDNTMEECKEESSERGLLNHFSDDIFENKMYSTPLDGLKFDEDRDLNSNELSLAFGNHHVSSKMEEAFDVHTNLSMVNNSMVDDLKVGRGSAGGLFDLSGNVKTSNFHNAWVGTKSNEFKSSGSKFTTDFGGNISQAHEEVVPSGMWRTGDVSQLQSGLSNSSHAQIPSHSSFHSFNIMSDKYFNRLEMDSLDLLKGIMKDLLRVV
ncbi:uncharacterized protein [Rutidosis leptorrhynchoides]|uniref:uncharacterized protein isoform X2 n=1 Tax=Rutidosis leptorrhynchoides TaxID=125765 RepID=UPI003A98DC29